MSKEKPISFTAAMIKARREGRKSVTRRVIKLPYRAPPLRWEYDGISGDEHAFVLTNGTTNYDYHFVKPRYNVGDLLWVKESWGITRLEGIGGTLEYPNILYRADSSTRLVLNQPKVWEYCVPKENFKWRSPRFMPKWVARDWSKVLSVRPERVQDITLLEICKEGLTKSIYDFKPVQSGFEAWISLWDSINAKRGYSWESNPWIWRIEFKELKHLKQGRDEESKTT